MSVKYLLNELPESKLIPCNEANQAKIVIPETDSTITIVSYSPVTKLHVSTTNIDQIIYSSVVRVCQKIAENCNSGTPKYKFIMICSKDGNIPDAKEVPSCNYHILPNTTLCGECKEAGRINNQLHAWNEALIKVSNCTCLYNSYHVFFYLFSTQFLKRLYQMEVRHHKYNHHTSFFIF